MDLGFTWSAWSTRSSSLSLSPPLPLSSTWTTWATRTAFSSSSVTVTVPMPMPMLLSFATLSQIQRIALNNGYTSCNAMRTEESGATTVALFQANGFRARYRGSTISSPLTGNSSATIFNFLTSNRIVFGNWNMIHKPDLVRIYSDMSDHWRRCEMVIDENLRSQEEGDKRKEHKRIKCITVMVKLLTLVGLFGAAN
ncbi:hypothetical protein K493DRAFT_406509 [Basidiobolus meristosporus CBS 931.73]|uniref:Uncharacterized protein n=1 Tax=Basidiobolus meristosporus CBS 931.73 TaxID=1314790 RepID=A0A1Y1YL17_9FUNG|nr:hypothetical protein K493DRAFT_406509 [Basidiobolus meristosporus CBS 931.73]|eukprot:ORX98721.1 hypothetical protein K493DRAFT_406509 [Basidiobolus meristosporus CBS 931.73]